MGAIRSRRCKFYGCRSEFDIIVAKYFNGSRTALKVVASCILCVMAILTGLGIGVVTYTIEPVAEETSSAKEYNIDDVEYTILQGRNIALQQQTEAVATADTTKPSTGNSVIYNEMKKKEEDLVKQDPSYYYDTINCTMYVTSESGVNYRTSPSMNNNVQGQLKYRAAVHVVKKNDSWARLDNGKYIAIKYLSKEQPKKLYTDDEFYWLSHVIYAEAGICSKECQQAVGLVILNRVKSNEYPNSIEGVIKDRKNGWQYGTYTNRSYKQSPSNTSIAVAKELLEGDNPLGMPEDVLYQGDVPVTGHLWRKIDGEYFERK